VLAALLRLIAVPLLAYVAWRAFLHLRAGLEQRRAGLRHGGRPEPRPWRRDLPFDLIEGGGENEPASGQVISLLEDPYALLGVDADATDDEVAEAYDRLRAQNAPEKVAGLSDEIRETAERMTRRLDQALAEVRRLRDE
jgi:DnaJ-domain-containing protein 1